MQQGQKRVMEGAKAVDITVGDHLTQSAGKLGALHLARIVFITLLVNHNYRGIN